MRKRDLIYVYDLDKKTRQNVRSTTVFRQWTTGRGWSRITGSGGKVNKRGGSYGIAQSLKGVSRLSTQQDSEAKHRLVQSKSQHVKRIKIMAV